MQNFSNSPAPPPIPPSFSGRSVGGPPYTPQPAEPQISPRMTDDYVGMQQQSLHRGLHHPSQASHMLAYGSRNRGALEPPAQGSIHSGNNNPYRKDAMEYYLSMSGKDRHRRGAMSFGGGFGYPNIDGHIAHQYRHSGSSSAPSSGLISPYPMDYVPGAGSGGGTGAFSPSHQYNINQNAAMQSVPSSQMQQRQHGQSFPAVHPGQQHRSYSHSGHRMTPQYPHYSPPGGPSVGSSGMYSPPLQRYLDGAANTGFDPKVNSSPSVNASSNSVSSSVAANNMGPVENVQQSYHASSYPGYPPQAHSLQKQATLQHRNSQNSLVVGYDGSLKMSHQGPSPGSVYAKHHSAPNPSIAQAASQEISKSPMHPNAQQMNQNFSPISNPSPAASAVHSPTCSSSPSPLMGTSEAHGNLAGHGPSHPSSNARSSHSHARLLQTAPQLSPTPNSNSSISSCGSSGSHKAHSLSAVGGSGLVPIGRNKTGASGVKSRDEGPSVYSISSFDKTQDAGLNSLNALSSQVANLPNTIQHMLITDTVFSHRRKDGGQQAAHSMPQSQPKSRNASSALSVKDGGVTKAGEGGSSDAGPDEDSPVMTVGRLLGTKEEREEQFFDAERIRVRQMSGASSGSEATGYHQIQTGHALKTVPSRSVEAVVTETKTKETHIPSSSSSPSPPPVSSSPSSTSSSIPPATVHNCVPESGLTHGDHRGREIKTESDGAAEKTQNRSKQTHQDGEKRTKNGQDKENMLHSECKSHNNKREEKDALEEQQNTGSVGVIVSARTEESYTERNRHSQDNCVEEKRLSIYLKESSSHNGEEGIDLSLNSSHQKSNSGRSQNPPLSGSHKYSFPESTCGSDLSMKNRVRAGSVGVMETNPRYLSYQHSQTGYGSAHPKDAGSGVEALARKGQQGVGAKAQEENSQMQQFPSLLQEVLQGYNLDRRYVRPEQAFAAHQVQQQFSTRHTFEMADSTRMHGESSAYSARMSGSGKQKNRHVPDFSADAHSLVKSEMSSAKTPLNTDKADVVVSQSHLLQAAESQQPPAKHINLSDYSLTQRKTPNVTTASSAVQELLLQEPEPLTNAAGQSKSQKSTVSGLAPSERRSVICDVSPNRSSTPERVREGGRETEQEKSQSSTSVIQQSFSSPAAPSDLSKRDKGEKHVVKMEMTSKDTAAGPVNLQIERNHGVGGVNEADIEFFSKPSHLSSGISADPYRRGSVDIIPMPSHSLSTNTLSSPPRHHSYLHSVDLSAGSGSSFPGYRYGETREGSISRSFPSHHPYHHLPPQAPSTNKLQMYPRGPPHPPHDMSDWVKAMSRPSKEMMMMQLNSSPGRHRGSQLEQKQRVISQTDVPSESKTHSLHHQSAYYDIKMWDSIHQGRDGARMIEGDTYYRTQAPPPSPLPSPASVGPHAPLNAVHGQNEPEVSRGATEEAKHPCPPPASSSAKPPGDINSTQPQRPPKSGGSGDTNPLMLRRKVRSFISPIPAKRLHQDSSQQRAATNSHHSPGAPSESGHHHNEDDSSSSDVPCPRLSSPLPGENTFLQPLSPPSGNAKVLSARKGRGLKLEAIVQKITPNIKKPTGYTDDESNHFSAFSHSEIPRFNDSHDQDLAHFPRVPAGEESYMDDTHSLNDMIPFRGVDETGPLPPPVYPCDSSQSSQILKQQDFDFGLGAGVTSASGDKEDFTLLGPLPPPPPLPRPVQASSPPSSSALSDIQHFTNTYQQLETRKGEQSAANLLRQKLQETGMGFDDYLSSDYYGTTPPHQGHMLSRQHQMSSGRSSLSPQDSKPLENVVPKGYFPSGKKKGRPVGSVNKQKRAQNQGQPQAQAQVQTSSTPLSDPPAPPTPTPAAALTPPIVETNSSALTSTTEPTPTENTSTPPLAPPVLTQVVKVDIESEDTQPEIELKPARRRRQEPKDEDMPLGTRGGQRRRRRGAVTTTSPLMTKGDPETPPEAGATLTTNKVFMDPNRKGIFIPHIHVEKKIPEIGAVCSIVNAEEDKTKGDRSAVGGKTGGTDSLLSSAVSSPLSRRDKEAEKREADEVETTLQSGKALPSSGYVVSGPVITETNHSGRLLCCLCQKWANYKHLGDLYGPYYPAEYAAKLPKNQPQIRQCQATTGTNKTGPNSDTSSNATSVIQDSQAQQFSKGSAESDCATDISSNTTPLPPTIRSAFSAGKETVSSSSTSSPFTSTPVKTCLSWGIDHSLRPIPELKRETDLESDQVQAPKPPTDDTQQRPQHRKLTSHPRFKRRHKSSEESPRMVPSNSKASLPFQPPPPALDSLGPLAQLAQLPQMPMDPEELWVHEGCIVWTSGVYLVNGRLYGLQEALDGARETVSVCCV